MAALGTTNMLRGYMMNQNVGEPSSLTKEYLKEEQKQRRQEIENLIERTESDQKNGLVITGAFWAWLATNSDKLYTPVDWLAVWLPTIIMLFFFYRWRMLSDAMDQAADYMIQLEEYFKVPDGLGWEHYLKEAREKKRIPEHMEVTAKLFWQGLIVVNVAIAVVFMVLKKQ